MVPRVLGLTVVQANFVITLYLASGVPGDISALNWAWQLTMLPLGIFGMAIGTAVFPSLAEQTARSQLVEMTRTAVGALRMVMFLTIPAAIGLIVLATPVVRLLYERQKFDATATQAVAGALSLYAIGLVGMAAIEIITRALYALQDTRTPVAIGFGAMLLNAALAVTLLPHLGHRGLALATGCASLVEALVLVSLCARRLPGLVSTELIRMLVKSAIAAFFMGALVYLVRTGLEPALGTSTVRSAILVGACIGIGGASYLVAAWALGIEEMRRIWQQVAQRVR